MRPLRKKLLAEGIHASSASVFAAVGKEFHDLCGDEGRREEFDDLQQRALHRASLPDPKAALKTLKRHVGCRER